MKFTGERYLPEVEGDLRLEHVQRYYWALEQCRGKRVLDAACGEGYGSAVLAGVAREVVGVDIAEEAVASARAKYAGCANLSFLQASVTRLPFADASFDRIVSFETLEHLAEQERMLAEFRRVLRADGLLVLSSPNRPVYNETLSEPNPFHVRELDFAELDALLRRHFGAVSYAYQRPVSGIGLIPQGSTAAQLDVLADRGTQAGFERRIAALPDPVYLVAVCASEARWLPELAPALALSEVDDPVRRQQETERWAHRLEDELAQARQRLAQLQSEFDERSRWALELDARVARADGALSDARRRPLRFLAGVVRDALAQGWRALRRRIGAAARLLYRAIPVPEARKRGWAPLAYRYLGPLLRDTPGYDTWARQARPAQDEAKLRARLRADAPVADEEIAALVLPCDDHPQVSVVIPAYGNLPLTLMCLKSIAAHPPKARIEVLVAENCSGDPCMERLREVRGLRYEVNPSNLGFLRSCNRASTLARGEFIFLLNNDTEVQPGWLDTLLECFRDDPACGLAGSKLVFADGRLQEAGGIVWRDASAWNFGRLQDPDAPEFNYRKEVDYVSGAAILFRRSVFEEVGRFDERYVPAYCEDTDLAFEIRRSGRKVVYEPRSVVVHYEGVTHGTDVNQGVKAYQVANREKFLEKWRAELEAFHFPNGENVFLARDRSRGKPCVLVVDHYIPQPDRDAGSRSMYHLVQVLVEEGYNVKFWPDNLYHDRTYAAWLQRLGVEVFYGARYLNRFDEWIKENGAYLQAAILSRPQVAVNYIEPLRRHSKARLLYYGHDLHHQRMRMRLALEPGGRKSEEEAERMEALEREIWRRVDTIYYPSDAEADYVRASGAAARVLTLPLLALREFAEERDPGLPARRDLLFVAGFGHPPNEDAALWLVEQVLPRVRKDFPALRLFLVGSNPTDRVRALARMPGVVVTGFVSDRELRGHYARARVAVIPLRYGAGMKGKVLEAMQWGVPLVTTPVGVQGLDAVKSAIPVHESPEDFAAALLELMRDDDAWQRQREAQLKFVKANYAPAAMIAALRQGLE